MVLKLVKLYSDYIFSHILSFFTLLKFAKSEKNHIAKNQDKMPQLLTNICLHFECVVLASSELAAICKVFMLGLRNSHFFTRVYFSYGFLAILAAKILLKNGCLIMV